MEGFCFLFIYWLCWVFTAACRLSLVAVSWDYSLEVRASHHGGFSCCRKQALSAQPSVAAACRLVAVACGPGCSGPRDFGVWAPGVAVHGLQLLYSSWSLPGWGIKSVSPALAADSYPLFPQGSPTPGDFSVMLSSPFIIRWFIISSFTHEILRTVSKVHRLTCCYCCLVAKLCPGLLWAYAQTSRYVHLNEFYF